MIPKAGGYISRVEVVDLICGDLATRESIAGNGEGIGDDGVDTIARTSSSFDAEVPGYQYRIIVVTLFSVRVGFPHSTHGIAVGSDLA